MFPTELVSQIWSMSPTWYLLEVARPRWRKYPGKCKPILLALCVQRDCELWVLWALARVTSTEERTNSERDAQSQINFDDPDLLHKEIVAC